jgi:trimethylamine--corrinoid protein Co-methyltransferase
METTSTKQASGLKQREGVLVTPRDRLSERQLDLIDGVSRELLEEPGLLCYNARAAEAYKDAGARVEEAEGCLRVRLPGRMIDDAIKSAPSRIVLGARDPDNRLVLDAAEPRVRFGSGAETNVWLDVQFDGAAPRFERLPGSIERLKAAAHLADNLENLDFFIRCVNIRDKEVTSENKDVNKFLASFSGIRKHVQAGLTSLGALDEVLRLGHIVAGGEDAFRENPVLSFIACVIKSPLQVVEDTAAKVMAIAKRRVPIVISSSPMGGATAPFREFGMVAQINAEILAGITLTQIVSPGTPVLYGSVPVRTRLDNLNDMYGAPEFNHYHIDCAQLARRYAIPCYSSGGIADASEPGIQATVEKLVTISSVPRCGPQYLHYAFGLLERTNVFCPEQAVLDDAHIGIVKYMLAEPDVCENDRADVLAMIREVMATDHRTYMYHLPLPTQEPVYVRYPLESSEGGALRAAHDRFHEIMKQPRNGLPAETAVEIQAKVPGVLPQTLD